MNVTQFQVLLSFVDGGLPILPCLERREALGALAASRLLQQGALGVYSVTETGKSVVQSGLAAAELATGIFELGRRSQRKDTEPGQADVGPAGPDKRQEGG